METEDARGRDAWDCFSFQAFSRLPRLFRFAKRKWKQKTRVEETRWTPFPSKPSRVSRASSASLKGNGNRRRTRKRRVGLLFLPCLRASPAPLPIGSKEMETGDVRGRDALDSFSSHAFARLLRLFHLAQRKWKQETCEEETRGAPFPSMPSRVSRASSAWLKGNGNRRRARKRRVGLLFILCLCASLAPLPLG